MKRRRLLTALIALADALALPAFAQPAWPTRLVKIVVPAPACSSLDLIVRAMSDKLGARWGQPVVMENQPGAGGKVNCSSLGKGSSAHLTMELFLSEAGITATHIPFNGSPPAAMAGAQGEADATFMVAPALLAHVRNNKVRLLAASSAQRPDSQKDLPTLADAGYRGVESLAWNGLLAPAGAPDTVVSRINADVNDLLKDPAVKAALEAQGLTAVDGSAADFKRVLDAEARRWGPIITRIGVKLD